MDEDWARRQCDLEDEGKGVVTGSLDTVPEMTPLGYTEIASRLDLIADRVLSVRTAVQAGNSKDGKEPTFTPMRQPVTALERERERRTTGELAELDAMIRGGGLPFELTRTETER